DPGGWAPAAGWGAPPGWGSPVTTSPSGGPAPVPPAPGGAPGGWAGYGSPAWAPAPLQPGIVPLRPLSLGEVLDGAFRAVRANPAVMFGLSALVVTVAVAIGAVLQWYLSGYLVGGVDDAFGSADPSGLLAEQLGAGLGLAFVSVVLLVATPVLTGLVIVSVSRSVLGRKISFGEALRQPRAWLVLLFTVLLGLAATVAVVLVVLLVVAVAQQSEGLAAVVGLVAALALLVVTVWVSVRTLLVPPAIMLEGGRFWPSVQRAWRLSRGSFWRLLGTYLLVNVLLSIVQQVVLTPAGVLAGVLGASVGTGPYLLVLSVATVLATTLATTYLASVVALLYIDVRMRREGLDIELARAASATA
uniref:glycerophosphoryl diester phosphodiesterase membrane domain-containing protein n=1 Tax=Cellulomonas endophytica TaxID=2494735 RepID=UPI00196B5F98